MRFHLHMVCAVMLAAAGPAEDTVMPPIAPEPPVGEPLQGLQVFAGWSDPRALAAPVNTRGWEDSAYISYDGGTLFFGYTPLDYTALIRGEERVVGPQRPGAHGLRFDIYEARIVAGAWEVVNSTVNAEDPQWHEASVGLDAGQALMAFVRWMPLGEVFLSARSGSVWGTPVRLPEPVNLSGFEADNPHLSADGTTLYFDSTRPTGEGREILVSTLGPSGWSAPTPLGVPTLYPRTGWQVFTWSAGHYIGWSDTITPTVSCLVRARRMADGTYGDRSLIALAADWAAPQPGDVIAVGEQSISGDGRFLYFVYMQYLGPDACDLGIGVARSTCRFDRRICLSVAPDQADGTEARMDDNAWTPVAAPVAFAGLGRAHDHVTAFRTPPTTTH